MRQNDELKSIKAKIKALTEKTVGNGCSEHEAMAAAALAGRLLEQYSLSMEEIDVREEPCVTLVHKWKQAAVKTRPDIYVLPALARFCEVKLWTNSGLGELKRRYTRKKGWHNKYQSVKTGFSVFGFQHDCDLALYLYEVILKAHATELRAYKRSADYLGLWRDSRKSASVSFTHGFYSRLSYRLDEMHNKRKADLDAAREKGTALILLKGNVIEEEFKKSGVTLTAGTRWSRSVRDDVAYSHGSKAGERVNLSRPVGGTGRTVGLIGG